MRSRAVSKPTTQDWGFTAQLSYKGAVFGRGNRVTVGVAYDGHSSSFNQSEAEADLIPDGNSVGVQQTEPFETAVDVHTTQQNVGVYITDTFDITDWMALTHGHALPELEHHDPRRERPEPGLGRRGSRR